MMSSMSLLIHFYHKGPQTVNMWLAIIYWAYMLTYAVHIQYVGMYSFTYSTVCGSESLIWVYSFYKSSLGTYIPYEFCWYAFFPHNISQVAFMLVLYNSQILWIHFYRLFFTYFRFRSSHLLTVTFETLNLPFLFLKFWEFEDSYLLCFTRFRLWWPRPSKSQEGIRRLLRPADTGQWIPTPCQYYCLTGVLTTCIRKWNSTINYL